MRKPGIAAAVLAGILLLGAAALYGVGRARFAHVYSVPAEPIAAPTDSATLARGRHIATVFGGCDACHGKDLGGKLVVDAGLLAIIHAPNLTRGSGGIGASRTVADFERAIRHGVRADGHGLMLMPSQNFQYMDDADVTALIAYVRSVPPVDHVQPPSRVAPLGYLLLGAGRVHLAPAGVTQGAPHPSALPSGPLAAYGKYLVDVAGCRGCHGPALSGRVVNSLSVTHLIAGARDGVSTPAANLTPAGLGTWTEADFFRSLREGKLPGGGDVRAATSDRGMPWQLIGQMTDDELRAIWAYLKIVPPKPYGKG